MSISKEQLLQVFLASQKLQTAVGIRLKGRKSLLITSLEQVHGSESDDCTITVLPESIYGETLPSSRFHLNEIDQIFNLRIRYNDPFYEYLRSVKTNIKMIRREAGLEHRTTTF